MLTVVFVDDLFFYSIAHKNIANKLGFIDTAC